MQKLPAQKLQLHGVSLPTPDSATQSERGGPTKCQIDFQNVRRPPAQTLPLMAGLRQVRLAALGAGFIFNRLFPLRSRLSITAFSHGVVASFGATLEVEHILCGCASGSGESGVL
jgi:hypothetical protein